MNGTKSSGLGKLSFPSLWETNDIKGETFDEYKSIIGEKPSKDKGKDTELMPDYDMTGENVSNNVLEFSDDSDDESEEMKEMEEEEKNSYMKNNNGGKGEKVLPRLPQ